MRSQNSISPILSSLKLLSGMAIHCLKTNINVSYISILGWGREGQWYKSYYFLYVKIIKTFKEPTPSP